MKQRQKYLSSLSSIFRENLLVTIEFLIAGKRDKLDIKQLHGEDNAYRCRVGKLRIIFTVEGKDIIIKYIGPRGNIYK